MFFHRVNSDNGSHPAQTLRKLERVIVSESADAVELLTWNIVSEFANEVALLTWNCEWGGAAHLKLRMQCGTAHLKLRMQCGAAHLKLRMRCGAAPLKVPLQLWETWQGGFSLLPSTNNKSFLDKLYGRLQKEVYFLFLFWWIIVILEFAWFWNLLGVNVFANIKVRKTRASWASDFLGVKVFANIKVQIKPSKMKVAPQGCLQITNKKTTNKINWVRFSYKG